MAVNLLNQFVSNANQIPMENYLPSFYTQNDVVLNSLVGKLPPPVKDDSGVTFNNSFAPPVTASRKRPRDLPILIASDGCGLGKGSCDWSFLGEDLSILFAHQQLELDRLISHHMEKMKMEIEERKRHQIRRIISSMEKSVSKRLRTKEEEIQKMTKINFALEERVKSLHLENQIWRDLAQSNEATANALRTNLEQVLQSAEARDDAVSSCGSSGSGCGGEGGDISSGEKWIYRGKKVERRMCRRCGEGESRVLVLPCRHLCLCRGCGPLVNCCPVCEGVKNASVCVNFS